MGRYAQARRRGGGNPLPPATLDAPVYGVHWVFEPNGFGDWEVQGLCPWPEARLYAQLSNDAIFAAPNWDGTGPDCSWDDTTSVPVEDQFTRAQWVDMVGLPLSNFSEATAISAP